MDLYEIFLNNLGRIIYSAGVFIAAFLVREIVKKALKAAFSRFKGKINDVHLARTNTVRLLLVNIINLLILIIAVLMVLSKWGIDIRPILAGVGILGIAVSFGSQSLVKDFISGFFIIIEDQFHIGDTIKIGTVEGEVKKITMRSTVIKDTDGNRVYIPNSKIDIVTRLEKKSKKKG